MTSIPVQNPPVDDDYDEDEDEDFSPEAAAAVDEASASSDSDEETATTTTAKRKRTKGSDEAEDVDFENSGDEATIRSGRKKTKKSKDIAAGDDEEGGEGGLIKTRAQRKLEQKEKKALATSKGASVDVNALWAQMASGPKPAPADEKKETDTPTSGAIVEPLQKVPTVPSLQAQEAEPTILIKRTYDFAGQTMTEEKQVLASSAEAKLYLAELERQKQATSNNDTTSTASSSAKPPLRRPKKRASMFGNGFNSEAAQETKKLTTLEKSKLDWAQHVDQHGISEELNEHSKAKDTYLGRMDFLGRMEAKRENEARERRTKG